MQKMKLLLNKETQGILHHFNSLFLSLLRLHSNYKQWRYSASLCFSLSSFLPLSSPITQWNATTVSALIPSLNFSNYCFYAYPQMGFTCYHQTYTIWEFSLTIFYWIFLPLIKFTNLSSFLSGYAFFSVLIFHPFIVPESLNGQS